MTSCNSQEIRFAVIFPILRHFLPNYINGLAHGFHIARVMFLSMIVQWICLLHSCCRIHHAEFDLGLHCLYRPGRPNTKGKYSNLQNCFLATMRFICFSKWRCSILKLGSQKIIYFSSFWIKLHELSCQIIKRTGGIWWKMTTPIEHGRP